MKVAQKGEPNPDEEISTEVSDAPCFADPHDQFEYWKETFYNLAQKAAADGIQVVCCFGMVNPIDHDAMYNYCSNGDVLSARGLLEFICDEFRM